MLDVHLSNQSRRERWGFNFALVLNPEPMNAYHIFLRFVFYSIEQCGGKKMTAMPEKEIEIIIDQDVVLFSWNDEAIQRLAEELGNTDFPEPRPCG